MIDLAQKYKNEIASEHDMSYEQSEGLGWYALASAAVQEAEYGDEPIANTNAYMSQFVTPEHMAFILYTDDATKFNNNPAGTMFSCVPIKDDGNPVDYYRDDGICTRFNWVVECCDVFDDMPFEAENLSTSWEFAEVDLGTMRTYFEGKGFKVSTGVWE